MKTPEEYAGEIASAVGGIANQVTRANAVLPFVRRLIEETLAAERKSREVPGQPASEEWLSRIRGRLGPNPGEGGTDSGILLAHVAFLGGLVRDLGCDDPGKLEQWKAGRDAGLEEAASEAEKWDALAAAGEIRRMKSNEVHR